MARVIPKEQLAAYQRWQVGSFGEAPKPTVPVPPAASSPSPDAGMDPGIPSEMPLALPTAEQIESIHEQARNEGFQAGYDEGRQAAEAEIKKEIQRESRRISDLLTHFRESVAALDQVVAEQTLDLALEVASLVVGSTVKAQPELLIPIIREALQALPVNHSALGIHVHPGDLDLLREHVAELAAQANFQLIPDSSVTPGGCLIKAGQSEIDAQLETRWKRVLEAIGADAERWQIR